MPGLVPGIHDFFALTWIAGTSRAMTQPLSKGFSKL
jgi:hypothetical protein